VRRTGSARRILIVEDNADAADSLAILLRMQGHHVEVARSGTDGLELAAADRPEVILLDIGMPEPDGWAVATRLRADARFDRVRLIAITGYGMESDRRRSAEAGIDHHLLKPCDLEELEALLDA
jgi:two-component system CheB/CheR fusion protein